ncbi:MAG: hypothetical protein EAZ76_12840 [Nostocales cyanobacterium]|nr:MAG: hypothetical protein EAZ87_20055 [Nostocales cyanobacterium]TAF12921.1 MAG: hypothetical protein EAZ76_12840 [Nostocales cyanobacterium]
MMSQMYYILRSKTDGKYLTARVDEDKPGYLLLFKEDFDALSYLTAHAGDLASRLAVEAISSTQLSGLLQRWGFAGLGMVNDSLIPKVEFLQHGSTID